MSNVNTTPGASHEDFSNPWAVNLEEITPNKEATFEFDTH